MKVLGIIPARGGSKGVPRKNIRLLCEKPLIAYTIESALNASRLTRTILSTEDEEIAEVGMSCGVDVPFLRPKELAEDFSPTLPVVLQALETLEHAGEQYDAVCLLQPTNPLRRSSDIDSCIELLERTGADSVISILPVPAEYNPKWVYWKSEDGTLGLATGDNEPTSRRQDLPPAFHREGSVYVTRTEVVRDQQSLYGKNILGYEISPEFSSNIDTLNDWQEVEARISRKNGGSVKLSGVFSS
ncbi:MAG: acylneuraminate cytidylyltransferase family protein [Acidobacteria bacterium]|nr:acylneuraminate cytidylyltransferase family protein [Acidobacteriota bacterium]